MEYISTIYDLSLISERYAIREPAAEFLGTMIFIIFGTGVNCQVFLSINPNVEVVPRGVSECYLLFLSNVHGLQY